ncbi:MAG: esterase [Dehalococcoidia bacterium]|nr:esterase [Dehalococcoidia bacterium]
MIDIDLKGRIVLERFSSEVLRDNPLGDPHVRSVLVYLPPGYDERSERYPVIFCLAGFTGTSWSFLRYEPFGYPLPARFERLIEDGRSQPAILVLVDGMTRVGGNQYINSEAVGRYEDHIVDELVPFIDGRYRTLEAGHRGVMGKSSGGYGAIVHGMRHPDVWSAVACHSGDMYFEYCYLPDFPPAIDGLRDHASVKEWLEAFEARPKKSGQDIEVLNIVAMSAFYSPGRRSAMGIDLPFDTQTGKLRNDVWQRWLEHDPVRLAARFAEGLKTLKLLFIDCGTRDQFNLHHGARILASRLRELGVPHEHQEFEDNHSDIQYRYDVSLPRLSAALAAV